MALVDTLQEKTAPLVAPIDGANPVGADPTFETDFEAVKKEIDKLSSVEDKPNWGSVATGSAAILKNKAKDFRIAIWSTIGLMQGNSWAGFAEGLVTMRGLVTQHWDAMYPDVKRGRARANMMSWMIDQSAAYLEKAEVNGRNGEAVTVSNDML
ncbi:MAG: type VI secretion system ImpA family N-terminal domain-containing protein, partial [Polyangiales bacterium]